MSGTTDRTRVKVYLYLALIMTLVTYVVAHVILLAHELAHGGMAVALGGYFPFIQIDADGGRSVYVFPSGSGSWKEALVLLAGPSANFLISVFALSLAAAGIRSKPVRLLTVFTGGLSALMLVSGTGLVPPWWPRYKETGEAFHLLGLPVPLQWIIKSFCLAVALVILASFFRLFFRELAEHFPCHTYRERFLLVTAGLGAPVIGLITVQSLIMLSSGYGEGVITLERHSPHVAFLVLTYFLLPALLKRATPEHYSGYFKIPRLQFAGCVVAAAAFAIAQPVVFGNDRINPSGLFLSSRPPEVAVSTCNLRITVSSDRIARVQLLMRAFPKEHRFLWERVKDVEPEEWQYYDQAARELLPAMLGIPDIKILGHRSDKEAAFFNDSWQEGARIVEAEFALSQLPRLRGDKGLRVLKLLDPWKEKGIGFIDQIAVSLAADMTVGGVGSQPVDLGVPTRRSASEVEWENRSLNKSATVVFVGISDPALR